MKYRAKENHDRLWFPCRRTGADSYRNGRRRCEHTWLACRDRRRHSAIDTQEEAGAGRNHKAPSFLPAPCRPHLSSFPSPVQLPPKTRLRKRTLPSRVGAFRAKESRLSPTWTVEGKPGRSGGLGAGKPAWGPYGGFPAPNLRLQKGAANFSRPARCVRGGEGHSYTSEPVPGVTGTVTDHHFLLPVRHMKTGGIGIIRAGWTTNIGLKRNLVGRPLPRGWFLGR